MMYQFMHPTAFSFYVTAILWSHVICSPALTSECVCVSVSFAVDGCIHKAAGGCLYDECHSLNGCETGKAKITCGYDLPAKCKCNLLSFLLCFFPGIFLAEEAVSPGNTMK